MNKMVNEGSTPSCSYRNAEMPAVYNLSSEGLAKKRRDFIGVTMPPDNAKVYDLICKHNKDGIKDRDIAKRLGMTVKDVMSITHSLHDEKMVMYIHRLGWVVWQKPVTEL